MKGPELNILQHLKRGYAPIEKPTRKDAVEAVDNRTKFVMAGSTGGWVRPSNWRFLASRRDERLIVVVLPKQLLA
jgi:hypothetical protein